MPIHKVPLTNAERILKNQNIIKQAIVNINKIETGLLQLKGYENNTLIDANLGLKKLNELFYILKELNEKLDNPITNDTVMKGLKLEKTNLV